MAQYEEDLLNTGPMQQSEEDRELGKRILKRWDQLDTEAINWKTHWQLLYENIVPRKEDVIASRWPGDRRNGELFDTTAILANEMLASALHGMLTNPETKFFEITFGDPKLDQDEQIKNWCQDVGDRMFRVLNNTNFQTEIYEIYIDLGATGTACLFMGEHDEYVVHFSARALKEIRIAENNLGLIDVVLRTFKWKPYQIIQEFGADKCPYEILKLADNNEQDQIQILHSVEPMDEMKAKMDPKKHRYRSTYLLQKSGWVLSKNGFREFPYAVPRWSKTTGETYGRGPGMAMLPDIMMVNAMMMTVIQGAQKTVDPPLMVEDDGVIGVVRLTPGGLTIVRPGSAPIKPLIIDARIDFGQKMVEDVRNRIRAGFYVDQLQLQQGPQMTAEEVKQRTEEKLRLMGPVLGRQHFELLKPLITRLFDIMNRKGLLPPAPVKIQGKEFDVRYSSLIAKAQRVSEAQNIQRAMALLEPLAKLIPNILDNVDTDKIAREVWGIYGNNHKLLNDKMTVDKRRKAQAQMAQKQQQMADQQHQAELAQKTAPMLSATADVQKQNQQGGNVPQ